MEVHGTVAVITTLTRFCRGSVLPFKVPVIDGEHNGLTETVGIRLDPLDVLLDLNDMRLVNPHLAFDCIVFP